MASMVRKQVYLTVEQDRRLRRAAREHRRTEAEIIRRALDRELGDRKAGVDPGPDALWDIVGVADGAPDAASERVDEYVYGRPRHK